MNLPNQKYLVYRGSKKSSCCVIYGLDDKKLYSYTCEDFKEINNQQFETLNNEYHLIPVTYARCILDNKLAII